MLLLLLVKHRVVDHCSLQKSLATRLLQLRIIHQELLLLCKVSDLTINRASNESSTTSGDFHKILSQFFLLRLCQDRLLRTCRGVSACLHL